MQHSLKYRKALITGGSSGIGKHLASRFLELGVDVFIVGLDKGEVEETIATLSEKWPDRKIGGLSLDLIKQDNIDRLVSHTQNNGWTFDLLVNSAGYARSGLPGEIPYEEEAGMIDLHTKTILRLTRLLLPKMIENNHGCIVNMSSVSAFQPNPTLAVYGASKAFVYNWSLTLRAELKSMKKKVQVHAICPTPVRTNFQKNARMENSILFNTWMTVNPELVVSAIIKAIDKDIGSIVPGRLYRWINEIVGRLPVSWRTYISSLHLKTKK